MITRAEETRSLSIPRVVNLVLIRSAKVNPPFSDGAWPVIFQAKKGLYKPHR